MQVTKEMVIEASQQSGCLLEIYDGYFSIHIDRVSVTNFVAALNEKLASPPVGGRAAVVD